MKMNNKEKQTRPGSISSVSCGELERPFEINNLHDYLKCKSKTNWEPKRQERYHIVWIKKGTGVHIIDTARHQLNEDMVYCIQPKQVQVLDAGNDIEGYMISFTADFLGINSGNGNAFFNNRLFGSGSEPAVLKAAEVKNEMFQIVINMQKEYQNFSLLKMEILREYLKIFLIYLTRQSCQKIESLDQPTAPQIVNRFFMFLQKNFITKKLVTDYASMLSISPSYLNNVVKKASGFPASYHIQQQIIIEAKRHAVYTGLSMKEIAYSLGFEENTHFSKFFKKIEGSNFSDYRKSARHILYS